MNEPMNEPPGLAYLDGHFIESDEGRPLRILAEYMQPMRAFQEERVQDTIIFFGSARLREDGPLGRFYQEARTLAHEVTRWSLSLACESQRFLVCTGGGGGIMEAANRGAHEAGGRSIGLNISLPQEQHSNSYITPALNFEFHYFFTRKIWFAHLARAAVVFPGGFGTLDELCEILTLSQTKKLARPIPILLYGGDYWREVLNFKALERYGMIDAEDLSLFHVVEHPEQAMELLKDLLEDEGEGEAPSFAKTITCCSAHD